MVQRLDLAVATYPSGKLGDGSQRGGQAGDGIDGEGPPFLRGVQGPDAAGLVLLQDQDVMGLLVADQELRVLPSGMQCVRRDHGPGYVQVFEQGANWVISSSGGLKRRVRAGPEAAPGQG
jgi:hypothetical protein